MQSTDPRGWVLRVTRGPNAGAQIVLSPGIYRFGRGVENDIVLADPAIATAQAVLRLDADMASLDVLAPGVDVGRRRATPGRPVRLKSRAHIAMGDTALHVLAPARNRSPVPFPVILGSGVLLAVALFVTAVARPSADRHAAAVNAPIPPASAAAVTPISAGDAAAALKQRMHDAGIDGRVRVDVKDAAIMVQGVVDSDAKSRWNAIEQWFDAEHADIALISDVTANASPAMPRLAIRAVWAGAVPYVISTSGEKFTEGAVIDGGWTIAHISENSVELTRNGRSVRMQL